VTGQAQRGLTVTEELVRAYSRRGNYHSDPTLSADLKLPGLVAQGMQAAGPAYGVLLDAWGDAFLANGEIDMRFVGVVLAGDTIEADVAFDSDESATFEVVDTSPPRHTAVVGHARRVAEPDSGGGSLEP
jgi:acyl dehydratase